MTEDGLASCRKVKGFFLPSPCNQKLQQERAA